MWYDILTLDKSRNLKKVRSEKKEIAGLNKAQFSTPGGIKGIKSVLKNSFVLSKLEGLI